MVYQNKCNKNPYLIYFVITRKYRLFSSLTLVAVNLFTCTFLYLNIGSLTQTLVIYGSYIPG